MLCGLSFAVNSLVMKYYVQKFNYGVIQLNLDGYVVFAPVLIAGYLLFGPQKYSNGDIAMAFACNLLSIFGTAAMTHALKIGKGGPI